MLKSHWHNQIETVLLPLSDYVICEKLLTCSPFLGNAVYKIVFSQKQIVFSKKNKEISYPDWRTGEEITCELSDALIGYHSHALVDTVGLLNKHLTTPLIYVVV